jgi:iron complex outermembrane receptor protein
VSLLASFAALAGSPLLASAQESDSLRQYDLGEIVVGGGAGEVAVPLGIDAVESAALERVAPVSVADALVLVPGAHVQTNSRGEALVYLRGAGERQVGIFLDGALLNVPWDNRFDLSALPASAIGSIRASVGAPALLYGANTLGGAINLLTTQRERAGTAADFGAAMGSGGFRLGEAAAYVSGRRMRFSAHVSLVEEDALALAAPLPFGQQSASARTNSDRRLTSALARVERSLPRGTFALTALATEARKGVPPEGHLDPVQDRVRYWRYPSLGTAMLIASGRSRFSESLGLRGSVWFSRFRQRIDQYETVDYERIAEVQEDRDATAGLRAVATVGAARRFEVAANWLHTRHDQTDRDLGASTALETAYAHRIGSLGGVYTWRSAQTERVRRIESVAVGASMDAAWYPETGDKPPQAPFYTPGLSLDVSARLGQETRALLAFGRKTRFPTPRELFGAALGRFLVNPDLRPETAYIGELGLTRRGSLADVSLTAFARRTLDTIDQAVVEIGGSRLRQRINLDGSAALGLEAMVAARPWLGARVDAHATLMRVRGRDGGEWARLSEKPSVLSAATLSQQLARWQIGGAVAYRGRAFSPDARGIQTPLPRSADVGAFVRRRATLAGAFLSLEARIDNLFDAEIVPQLGLPAPGRRFRLGLDVSL